MPNKTGYSSAKEILKDLYSKNLDLYKERKRLHEILTQVAEAIFAVDQDYKITLFNSSAEALFGVKSDDVTGKTPDEFIKLYLDDSDKEISIKDYAFKPSVENAFKKLGYETDIPVRHGHADPKLTGSKYFKLNFANIKLGESNSECVVSLSNITEEVAIDKQKDEFISVASHELKTPISIVNTNLWMFKHISKGKIDKKQLHFISEMEYGLSRLSKIVNNLLDISRIEQGRFVLDEKEQDIDAVIAEALKYFEDLTSQKGLKLIRPVKKCGKWVVDKDRFREALDNLISNAIKYTDKGGIKINLKPEKKQLTIMVTDSGPGITIADQKRLFKKFSRAKEGLKQETAGASTGLGLYITKRIIEEMGGKVGVTSKAGKGSTFWFTIPKKDKATVTSTDNTITKAKIEAIKNKVKQEVRS